MPIHTPTAVIIGMAAIVAIGQGCSSREGYVRRDHSPPGDSSGLAQVESSPYSIPDAPTDPVYENSIETVVSEPDIQLVSQPVPSSTAESEMASQLAPQPQASGVGLEELEQIALENNPAIRQLSAIAYKAAGVRDQVGAYPNPTIGYSAQQLADAGTDQHSVYVDQEIVMGDKLWLNEQVLNAAARAQF